MMNCGNSARPWQIDWKSQSFRHTDEGGSDSFQGLAVMTGTVLTAAALSAVFHAWWNILARQHDRPAECLAAMAIATASLCLAVLPFCGLPRFEAWPWLA